MIDATKIFSEGSFEDEGWIDGWFALENRITLEQLIRDHDVRSVLEIGSFLGLSTTWFAKRVDKVVCVDRWFEPSTMESNNNLVATLARLGLPNDFHHKFKENVRRAGVEQKVTSIVGASSEVHGLVGDVDLVYVDGDHSRFGCALDIRLYGPKARKIVCGDDYVARSEFGVIQAVDEAYPLRQVNGPFWWALK